MIRKEENGDITQIFDHEHLRKTLQDTSEYDASEISNTTSNELSIETYHSDYSFEYSYDM